MEKETITVLPFGKKIQVGNFTVLKFTKTLTKSQLKDLREDSGMDSEIMRRLRRTGLPYIRVEAISGIWAIEFCCNTGVYMFIDRVLPQAIIAQQEGKALDADSMADFAHMFGIWMTDTCVQGDVQYIEDKGNALQALIERQRAAKAETSEEKAADDKVLEGMKKEEEAKAAIVDMANTIEKGGSDEG